MGATWSCSWGEGVTSDFFHSQVFPEHRSEPALVSHLQVRDVLALLPDEPRAVGVGGDLIGRGDDGVHLTRVIDVATLRAVAYENARGVDHHQGGTHEGR